MSEAYDAVIVGGGISGLSTAYYLQQQARAAGRALSLLVLESGERAGGKVATQHVDGFTIEGGPDCFLSQKPWAADLCRQLGIGGDLIGTNDERRKTFVVNRGALTPLPDGVMLIIPTRVMPFVTSTLISWPGKMRMGMDLLIPRRTDHADETVGSFVRRRLGGEALDKIAEPLMSGIHVSDPEEQSLLATFPRFRDLEEKHGSLIRGMLARRSAARQTPAPQTGPTTAFITLRGGLSEIINGLVQALGEGSVRLSSVVSAIERRAGGFDVRTSGGELFWGRSVVLATPAHVSAGLVAHLSQPLGQLLSGIRYVSTATVSMGFLHKNGDHPLNGFGFVIPRREQQFISACTWSSTKFDDRAPAGGALLRSFIGGPGREDLVDLDDDQLLARVRDDLHRLMGWRATPDVVRIFRWHKANPQYDLGHIDRVQKIQAACAAQPGLFVTGSAYDGVGLPDCVRQGRQAATKALDYLRDGAAA